MANNLWANPGHAEHVLRDHTGHLPCSGIWDRRGGSPRTGRAKCAGSDRPDALARGSMSAVA